jgi:hypothetical protein
VILRDQFEAARRDAELHGTPAAVAEIRERVVLALKLVKDRLRPLEQAARRNDQTWLTATFTDWRAEARLLRDERQELRRLLDHLDLFLGPATGE